MCSVGGCDEVVSYFHSLPQVRCQIPSHSRLVVPPSPRRSGRCCCRVYGLQGQAEKGQAGRAEAKRVPRTQFRDQVGFMRQQHTKSSNRPHLLSSLHSSLALPSIITLTLTLLPTSLASTWLLLYTLMCGWIDTSGRLQLRNMGSSPHGTQCLTLPRNSAQLSAAQRSSAQLSLAQRSSAQLSAAQRSSAQRSRQQRQAPQSSPRCTRARTTKRVC